MIAPNKGILYKDSQALLNFQGLELFNLLGIAS
jgi:hypothetical protein